MDLELLKLLLTTANVGAGTIVLALLLREQSRMLTKMIETLTDLVDKLGEALVEEKQTNRRIVEFLRSYGKEQNVRRREQHEPAGRSEPVDKSG
jgi:hypothetical protein